MISGILVTLDASVPTISITLSKNIISVQEQQKNLYYINTLTQYVVVQADGTF